MRVLVAGLVAAVVGGIAVVSANQSTPQRQTFRTSTRLVQVSVVVHDARSRPIGDLRAEDFRVFEDGKEVRVAFFTEAADRRKVVAVPPGDESTFTNRIPSPANGGVVAILFDQLNTRQQDQSYARLQLVKYLQTLDPSDRVALYVLGSDGFRVLYDFSVDAQNLINVMKGVQPTMSPGMARGESPLSSALAEGLTAFARGVQQDEQQFDARVRAEQTLFALEDMADRLAGVPGRKNVVWVSSHFPFLFASKDVPVPSAHYMTPETRRVARALNDIDTAVYPVDVRGLMATAPHDASKLTRLRNVEDTITGLRMLAEWTGGRLFYNTNDLAASAAQAVEDSRFTYVLGYYPVAGEWDGRFRRIEVKVARPGVSARHRSGYYAFPLTPADPATRQKALADALKKPLEATGVLMNVRARLVQGGINLAIELGAGTVTLADEQGAWSGGVDVAIAQTLSGDRQIREPDFSMPLSLSAADRDRIVKQGLRLTRTIALNPDAQQVRIVVRDAATGATGSVIIEADRLRKAAQRRETLSTK